MLFRTQKDNLLIYTEISTVLKVFILSLGLIKGNDFESSCVLMSDRGRWLSENGRISCLDRR